MRELKKIIWATDGSKESNEALNYARFLAQKFGSKIIGVHVIEMPEKQLYEYLDDPESEFYYRWMEKAEESYKSKLASIRDELFNQGVSFQGEILKGEPNKKIVEFAVSEKADLIVMGRRGLGLIDRILIGSSTLKVLRESSVPVLAVKKRDKGDAVEIRSILVPLDVNEKVDSALNYAMDLAERINASISVLYVFRLYAYSYSDYETPHSVAEDLIKLSSDKLRERVEDIKLKLGIRNREATRLEINAEVVQGISTSVAIIDYASSKGIDLIVMNTHGRKGIKRFILGSVTEKVIQESSCAVLVLKP
ncbi:MAG: universal stress protein [Ignavibacteriales bacterium]